MNTFEIYFSDLNEDTQKRLLKAVGAEKAADMNWDVDICPIAMYDFEIKKECCCWQNGKCVFGINNCPDNADDCEEFL